MRKVLIFLTLCTSLWCSETEKDDWFLFLKETIPSRFVEPFHEHTKNNITIGIELLAIAQHESAWIVFFPRRKNTNSTTDHGPLGLNSTHLSQDWVLNVITKKASEYRNDSDVCYMIAAMYMFKELRNKHGTYTAYRIYNGGNNYKTKPATKSYADIVSMHESNYVKQWEDFKEKQKQKRLEKASQKASQWEKVLK